MPCKYRNKIFLENGCYHIYNRGVEKRKIFLDEQDYKTFLFLLKFYLHETTKNHPITGETISNEKCLIGKVDLFSYCLMPNHFHLEVKQYIPNGISKLMKYICSNYSTYFNKKYQRIGPLFQGIYKAILIEYESYLLQLSKYIHLNPVAAKISINPKYYRYSSYLDYLGLRHTSWIKTDLLLSYFRSGKDLFTRDILSYESFVENDKEASLEILYKLTIDEE